MRTIEDKRVRIFGRSTGGKSSHPASDQRRLSRRVRFPAVSKPKRVTHKNGWTKNRLITRSLWFRYASKTQNPLDSVGYSTGAHWSDMHATFVAESSIAQQIDHIPQHRGRGGQGFPLPDFIELFPVEIAVDFHTHLPAAAPGQKIVGG
jgi:hypothetical protein